MANEVVSEFVNSNSKVDIMLFFILACFIFVIILRLMIYITVTYAGVSNSPILINGAVNGNNLRVFEQDPSVKGSTPIKRSTNKDGISFTWSTWLNIDGPGTTQGYFTSDQHIFHKGNNGIDPITGVNIPHNAPGLYLSPNNELVVYMNTFDSIDGNKVVIGNIPRGKWFNVIIRVSEQYTLDVYINGKLVKRHILSGIPKQNYGNVYVGLNGGFSGSISSLRYYPRAISNIDILNLIRDGPNLKRLTVDNSNIFSKGEQYLSLQWFLSSHSPDYL